jgi:hypothetical protein
MSIAKEEKKTALLYYSINIGFRAPKRQTQRNQTWHHDLGAA